MYASLVYAQFSWFLSASYAYEGRLASGLCRISRCSLRGPSNGHSSRIPSGLLRPGSNTNRICKVKNGRGGLYKSLDRSRFHSLYDRFTSTWGRLYSFSFPTFFSFHFSNYRQEGGKRGFFFMFCFFLRKSGWPQAFLIECKSKICFQNREFWHFWFLRPAWNNFFFPSHTSVVCFRLGQWPSFRFIKRIYFFLFMLLCLRHIRILDEKLLNQSLYLGATFAERKMRPISFFMVWKFWLE